MAVKSKSIKWFKEKTEEYNDFENEELYTSADNIYIKIQNEIKITLVLKDLTIEDLKENNIAGFEN